jgi:fatty acid desaturase
LTRALLDPTLVSMGAAAVPAPVSRLSGWAIAWELARPLLLLGLFVLAWRSGPHLLAAPLALAAVFASSLLVHDLIHGSLGLPRRVNEVALSLAALLLVKSGHGLRVLHFEHHARCLGPGDVEGGVAHESFVTLAVRGPMLAAQARLQAFRAGQRTRALQAIETVANIAILAAMVWAHSAVVMVYWGCVVLVTITAPIWGAKIPHMVPPSHPLVRRLTGFTGRLTPATASVLLHELHHRFPRVPVTLLPANAHLLDTTEPSRCREVTR